MADLAIKGRSTMGNLLSKYEVHKVTLKSKGESTLGGRKIWFDPEVLRLNSEGRGNFLGEFHNEDLIQIIYNDGTFVHTNSDLKNHYDSNYLFIEKFNPQTVWSAVYFDAEQNCYYVKRFRAEPSIKPQRFIGDHPKSYLVKVMQVEYPRLEVKFGGDDKNKQKMIVEVADFTGVTSYKAKGKKLTNMQVAKIKELEPLRKDTAPALVVPPETETKINENEKQMLIFNPQ
jgi:topoisomerase-4 subunit A